MARIYRRSYRCRKTGKLKYVKGYTLEYKGADGDLVREPTKIVRKPLAERARKKRLRAVQRQLAGDPVDIFVNGRLIARGEVLVLNDNFCVRVAELIAGVSESS